MVGASREFVLGKHTGTHNVRKHLVESGFDPADEEVRRVTRRVKEHGAEKNQVTKTELIEFAEAEGLTREPEEVRAR
jgi:2-isopropylmalate synthase